MLLLLYSSALISKPRRFLLNNMLSQIRLPIEYIRKPRSLADLKFWKASEFRSFLLHIGPVILRDYLPQDHFDQFMALSVAIKLLCSDQITETQLLKADSLITFFSGQVVALLGELAQSYNIHTLRHLVRQVRESGPLWATSAFGFESANHFLKLPLTGTINQGDIIVRRFLARKYVSTKPIAEDSLNDFTRLQQHTKTKIMDLAAYTKPTREVEILISEKLARLAFPCESRPEGRFKLGTTLIHSVCYTRRRDDCDSIIMYSKERTVCYGKVYIFLDLIYTKLALVKLLTSKSYYPKLDDITIPSDLYMELRDQRSDLELEWIPCVNILRKCCLIVVDDQCLRVSVMVEQFEHD